MYCCRFRVLGFCIIHYIDIFFLGRCIIWEEIIVEDLLSHEDMGSQRTSMVGHQSFKLAYLLTRYFFTEGIFYQYSRWCQSQLLTYQNLWGVEFFLMETLTQMYPYWICRFPTLCYKSTIELDIYQIILFRIDIVSILVNYFNDINLAVFVLILEWYSWICIAIKWIFEVPYHGC